MQKLTREQKKIKKKLRILQKSAIESGINGVLLQQLNYIYNYKQETANNGSNKKLIVIVVTCFIAVVISFSFANSIIGARCLLPSNYFVWEATRPLADCAYCANVTKPIVLRNITRREFAKYAYSSRPIIVKNAISDWRASREFSYDLFKRLYERTAGSYESLEDGCQFLNFKTDLFTLKEVFSMPEDRVRNKPGQKPWGNCHPDILAAVRQYYSPPTFLPDDAEFPATENIFFGYEIGAVMHLDYIPRLMWQGQVKGNKTWSIAPVLECDHICQKFDFYVEAGDVVLLDTRIWYHATSIPKGQFSMTVQSEYG
ncbi:uncharacterized protein LOC126372531 isoform X2 [Pectinophora gossypiella]|uniref:uncharacterized protein LOC126372531 isoform X2 n=1 Tax=Pectinophora gossypiella TaxID=13191 RepID=UPI00214E87F7|nr:uncharacterized protein LOC126372531 isoform X2 [Pectinophora gossypiella]